MSGANASPVGRSRRQMKATLLIGCAVLCFAVLMSAQTKPAAPQTSPSASPAVSAAAQRALLDQYCVTCHSDKLKRANLSLEKLDLTTAGDHAELWEKVIRKLRAGVMPPPGIRRPPTAEYEGLRDWLEAAMERKGGGDRRHGAVVL